MRARGWKRLWTAALLLAAAAWPGFADTGDPALINEVLASHTGTDNTEFVELYGTPGLTLDGLSLIVVEGDAAAGPGTIEQRIDFLASESIGDNGFYLIGNCNGVPAGYGAVPDRAITDNFLENSSFTIALVETDSLAGDTVSGGEVVRDALGLTDGDDGDSFFFDASVLGPDGIYFPAGAGRLADGVDTDTAADWAFADFNLGSGNTPTGGGFDGCGGQPWVAICEIQGAMADHRSPYEGQQVTTRGIVTVVMYNGFFIMDGDCDGDEHTSDGIFVFTYSIPVVPGDEVEIQGTVSEYFPGGESTGNLSTTEIIGPTISVLSTGNPLPAPAVIGLSGRVPPTEVFDDDNFNVFDPQNDAIDFYETFEGMLVTLEDVVAVSPRNKYDEIFCVTNNGAYATGLNPRGGLTIAPDDFNPERVQIQLDFDLTPGFDPHVDVGDRLGDVTGPLGYNYGNFEVFAIEEFVPLPADLQCGVTDLSGSDAQLTVATYNVLNLDANDLDGDTDVADGQFDRIAEQIVGNLDAPHIIALQEIQDSSGVWDDGTVEGSLTYETLIQAIVDAGGPVYSWWELPPVDGEDGGIPGGNIRVGYLFREPQVTFVSGERLIDTDLSDGDAFEASRKPLAAVFAFQGEQFHLINNHFASKSGSSPLMGTVQPPVNGKLEQRIDQAKFVRDYALAIQAGDPGAKIIILGDLNEFHFYPPLQILEDAGFTILTWLLPELEQYSYNFRGNSQALDHILLSANLVAGAEYEVVHVNSEFQVYGSDHEPAIIRLPVNAGGSTVEGSLDISPSWGVVPFDTRFTVGMANGSTEPRYLYGRIDVTLPDGSRFNYWRAEKAMVGAGQALQRSWIQTIPALSPNIGVIAFTLTVEDITPPAADCGDWDSVTVRVAALAP